MRRTIGVFIWDETRHVGTLLSNREGARESAAFEYDPQWPGSAERFAIDPALPLVAGPQFHKKPREGSTFSGAIADTEPGGWGRRVILRDHAKRRAEARQVGDTERSPVLGALDFLLEVDDVSRVGALRFCDENGVFRRAPEAGRRTTPPLIELRHLLAATRAVEMNKVVQRADLAYLRGRGTSLGALKTQMFRDR